MPVYRRTEFTCTEEEFAQYADFLLHEDEVLYVKRANGYRDAYFGDGVTPLSGLQPLPNLPEMRSLADRAEAAADTATKAAESILDLNTFISMTSPVMRRNIYRGKDLGTTITDAQKTAISSGTFDDLFVGDFWTLGGKKYTIADIDYWYNTGNTTFTKHHLVMIPNAPMYNHTMNDTDTTEGGYAGSKMRTEGLNQAKETIQAAFGDMLLTYKEYLTNAVSGNHASAGAWYDSDVELMNEIMVYGSLIFGNVLGVTSIPTNRTIDKQQLAIFKLNPKDINKKQNIWLRDVVSSNQFANVNSSGFSTFNNASTSYGVRPVFPIGVK